MKKLNYALFLILILFSYKVYSQGIPCMPEYTGFYQIFKTPQSYPQFYTDTPYETMIAYIAMDSVARYGNYREINNFITRLNTKNDSLKFLRKYFYCAIDYDPVLF